MFGSCMREGSANEITLPGIGTKVFRLLFNFMYTNRLVEGDSLDVYTLLELLVAADQLMMVGVV
jgi:Kelch-like protein 33-like, BTB/POZ domain